MEHKKDIRETVKQSNSILVLCGDSVDSLSAGLAFSIYVKDVLKKRPKLVYIGNDTGTSNNLDWLLSLYDVDRELKGSILKLELDYKDTPVKEVDCYRQPDESKVVFEMKPVNNNFDVNRVNIKVVPVHYDLVVSFGIDDVYNYVDNSKEVINGTSVINFDVSDENKKYGLVNIVDTKLESVSKLMFNKFVEWQYLPDNDVSKTLLIGMSGRDL